MRSLKSRLAVVVLVAGCLAGFVSSGVAAAWPDDDFNDIDPVRWSITSVDYPGGNEGDIGAVDGKLFVTVTNRSVSYNKALQYIEPNETQADQPWTYYTAVNFSSTVPDRTDLRLGFRFEMSNGDHAYLVFDSQHGMRMKYGNNVVAYGGPDLYQNWWYELKFAWDGVELLAWYREKGRSVWLGGANNNGLSLYASFTTYPHQLKIGQWEVGSCSSGQDVTMRLLVDYWKRTEPVADAVCYMEDEFSDPGLDPNKWGKVDNDFTYNSGSVDPDGDGHLEVRVTSGSSNYPKAQAFVDTICRLPDEAWTYYTAVNFSSTVADRTDLSLGFKLEMADGSYAYVLFDSRHGMRMKYGNNVQAYGGPDLYQNWWYELKFAWSGGELRGWYRERGRSVWLGGAGNTGLALYASSTTYPERIKVGQWEIGYASSGQGVTMTLLVDYWSRTEPAPEAECYTEDDFWSVPLDPVKWGKVENDFPYDSGWVDPDGYGHLKVSVTNGSASYPKAQAFVDTICRLPDEGWTYYTGVNFASTAANRADLRLGLKFEMADGSYAYLVFDSSKGMQMKYGNNVQSYSGPYLYQNWWYELKFVWDGVELRAWYREKGRSVWQGGKNKAGLALYSSLTTYPERVKTGQWEIGYCTSGAGVTMTLLVDYWSRTEPVAAPVCYTEDDFWSTPLDPSKWEKLENNFPYNSGSVDPDGYGHLKVSVTNDSTSYPKAQTFAETICRLPDEAWTYYTAVKFSSTVGNRRDLWLGFEFEITDGRWAFIGFDSWNDMTLRYQNSEGGRVDGATLLPDTWYDLKITWWNGLLRAFYRKTGEEEWLGGYELAFLPRSCPERVKIGQTDIGYATSGAAVTMTLLVDYWSYDVEPDCPICDLNRDGEVNFADYAVFAWYWDSECTAPDWCVGSDFDRGGRVDGKDLQTFAECWQWNMGGSTYFDLSRDGLINWVDFSILAAHYGRDSMCGEPDWCDFSDFDRSGTVDLKDLASLAERWLTRCWCN